MSTYNSQTRFDDGLEVAPSPAPESVSTHFVDVPGGYELGHKIPVGHDVAPPYRKYNDAGTESASYSGGTYVDGVTPTRPWYRKKRVLTIIAAAVVVVLGLAVGLGVGLTVGGDSSDESNDSSNADDNKGDGDGPTCEGGLCSKILSMSVFDDRLYVFARSKDKKRVKFIEHDGSDWLSWQNLRLTKSDELLSPPASQGWKVNGTTWRLNVFVVGNSGNTVYNNWLSEEEPWDSWLPIGQHVDSSLATCSVTRRGYDHRLDVWSTQSGSDKITKTFWVQDDNFSEDGFDGVTEESGSYNSHEQGWLVQEKLGETNRSPAVICAHAEDDTDRYHEIVWYNEDGTKALHSRFSHDPDNEGWTEKEEIDGKWIGDPSLFSPTDDTEAHAYFFGVKDDYEMYHFLIPESGSFDTETRRLKGNIASVPAFHSPREDVIDIVALGRDGKLMHQHYDGEDWLSEWEDLNIRASSAPAIRVFEDKTFILAVSEKGDLMVWTRESDGGPDWKDDLDAGQNLEGSLSLEYWT